MHNLVLEGIGCFNGMSPLVELFQAEVRILNFKAKIDYTQENRLYVD